MIWLVLSIPITLGCSLIFMSWFGMNLLPPEIIAHVGGLIILGSIWSGYRYYLWGNLNKLQDEIFKIKIALRKPRLNARNETDSFLHFCSTYWAKYCHNMVQGTGELMDRREQFKNAIVAEGDLAIPELGDNISTISVNAVRLQRFIDSSRRDNANRDDIENLIDWFSDQREKIAELFKPYLDITT